ncbi:MAG: maleylpyruvate isomerase family mycothiol-dependent enzyme [Acidimicrobiales bacterium]
MEVRQYIDELAAAGDRLAAAAADAGPGAAVPTCPGWTVRDLVHHVGGVHRWATSFVVGARSAPTTGEETAAYFESVGDDDLNAWFRAGLESLVHALARADSALECWTFLPAPSPLAFWARRQAHETAVHCADAEASARRSSSFPREFAADGVDELLRGFLARPRGRLVSDPAVTLAIRATDDPTAWTMRVEPDRCVVSPGVASADCVIAAPVSDLYLLLWNRRELNEPVTVEGDHRVPELWRERAIIQWT